jgi:hypothetical protein
MYIQIVYQIDGHILQKCYMDQNKEGTSCQIVRQLPFFSQYGLFNYEIMRMAAYCWTVTGGNLGKKLWIFSCVLHESVRDNNSLVILRPLFLKSEMWVILFSINASGGHNEETSSPRTQVYMIFLFGLVRRTRISNTAVHFRNIIYISHQTFSLYLTWNHILKGRLTSTHS